jgi:hypothetical protein
MVRVLAGRASIVAAIGAVCMSAVVALAGARPSRLPGVPYQWAQPQFFVKDFGTRAKLCDDLKSSPWVSWLSYAIAKVSDEWDVYASDTTLCPLAQKTAAAIISHAAPNKDGAGEAIYYMFSYALHHHFPGGLYAPKPAGRTWSCAVLPSFWGQNAWSVGRGVNHITPDHGDFAGASGPAAGAGYCQLGKISLLTTSAPFFSWAPDTLTCQSYYKLKEVPDPNNPGQTTNPEFPAKMWDDYQKLPCP